MTAPIFVLFLSSVQGHLVSRYGSDTATSSNVLIGARRKEGGGVEWDTDEIVALTEQEVARYSREYNRALADKALVKRTEAAYHAWVAKQHARAAELAAPPAPEPTPAAAPSDASPHQPAEAPAVQPDPSQAPKE